LLFPDLRLSATPAAKDFGLFNFGDYLVFLRVLCGSALALPIARDYGDVGDPRFIVAGLQSCGGR
jgi:hypothetical protein